MNYKNTWNTVVRHFKNHINDLEPSIQNLWEIIFSELFGYSKLMGLLISQEHLEVGSNGSLIPDILLKKDSNIVCAVELKQETITLNKRIEKQLFSYLKQAKLSVGIIIADKIYLYAYEYEKDDENQMSITIPFEEDNIDGINFIEVINRESFSKESIFNFVETKNKFLQDVKNIRSCLNDELIKSAVKTALCKEYTEEEVEEALKNISFNSCDLNCDKSQHSRKDKKKNDDNRKADSDYSKIVNDLNIKVLSDGGVPAKNYLRNYLISKNLLDENWEFNLASLNTSKNYFWINPKVDCINKNWCLALNDSTNSCIYLFRIPANSIKREEIKTRMHHHKDEAIQITIVKDNNRFFCTTCKIDYSKWLSNTIKY